MIEYVKAGPFSAGPMEWFKNFPNERGMTMTRRILVSIVFLALVIPISASAEDHKNYFALKGGVYGFRSDLSEGNIDVGFDGEVMYGRYLTRNIVIEAGSGYFHDGVNKGFGNSIKGYPVILTAKGIYPVSDFEIFIGGGLGVYFASFDGMVNGRIGGASDTLFGGHFLAGANYNLSRRLFVGVEGKYIITEKGNFDVVKATLNGYTATASLGFRF